MSTIIKARSLIAVLTLGACAFSGSGEIASDACGASQYQTLVNGPSSAVRALDVADDSRHYGVREAVEYSTPSRINFVHSGTAIESVTDPDSKVVRIFCG